MSEITLQVPEELGDPAFTDNTLQPLQPERHPETVEVDSDSIRDYIESAEVLAAISVTSAILIAGVGLALRLKQR